MGKVLALVLGVAVVGGIGYYVMYHHEAPPVPADDPNSPSYPKQRLDNVRNAVKRVEGQEQQHVDDIEKKMNEP